MFDYMEYKLSGGETPGDHSFGDSYDNGDFGYEERDDLDFDYDDEERDDSAFDDDDFSYDDVRIRVPNFKLPPPLASRPSKAQSAGNLVSDDKTFNVSSTGKEKLSNIDSQSYPPDTAPVPTQTLPKNSESRAIASDTTPAPTQTVKASGLKWKGLIISLITLPFGLYIFYQAILQSNQSIIFGAFAILAVISVLEALMIVCSGKQNEAKMQNEPSKGLVRFFNEMFIYTSLFVPLIVLLTVLVLARGIEEQIADPDNLFMFSLSLAVYLGFAASAIGRFICSKY